MREKFEGVARKGYCALIPKDSPQLTGSENQSRDDSRAILGELA
jgi:hypothetical protein